MRELSSAKWLYAKAGLFLVLGIVSAALLVLAQPSLRTVALLVLCVWAFARVYYFCFYVLERWVDPSFRFSGLISVAVYHLRKAVRR